MHFAKHGVKHIEASHPLESSIYHYRADHANAQWLRPMHASNSPLVRWSIPPPKRPLGTRIICHGSQPTCSFCGGAHAPCPAGVVELDLPRNSTETGPTKEAAAVPLDKPFESYSVQNATLDTPPMIVHVQYDPAAVCFPGETCECPPEARLSPDAPSPLLGALEDFTAYETCSSHLDCVHGKGPASFCDDNSHCVSCTKWDPLDPSASIDGRHPSQCDDSARRHGNFQHLDPLWPIEPQSRPMRLCASCRMNTSRQLHSPAMHTCPRVAHASRATALLVDDVDCTERYAQLVRCAGDSTWLFSRIEHFASGSDTHPHTQLIARELIPPSRTRDGLSASPPTFGSARLAMDDDQRHKLAANAAITCTDDGNLLLYGGGEGGTGTAWLIGEPPRTGDEYSVRRHGFRWRRPMAAWSANKSQTQCVEARPHMPELCEYDGKLTVLRYGGRVLAFTRSNLYAHGGRHVQVSSSRFGFEGWRPFQQLSFEQYTTAPENNLYFAAIRAVPTGSISCEQLLLGLFPGSINGRGGVYVSVSADSVNWGELRQIYPSEVHASWRTSDYPVDGAMTSTDVAHLSIVLQHGVAVPHRRRAASSPSEEPTDERAQAWCNARRPPIYCEYTFPWSVSRHNASHAIVRIGKLAPWLVQCRPVVDWPSHSGTRHVHDSLRADPSLPLLGSGPPRGAAVHAAAAPKRPSVAVLVASGRSDLQRQTLARKLESTRDFLLRPLRAVAEVSTFICLEVAQPAWQSKLMRAFLSPRQIWQFDACEWQDLSDVARRCCENKRQPICDAPEQADDEESASLTQFYGLGACFQRVLQVSQSVMHDFYIRTRPDLHWVGAFNVSLLWAPDARHRLGLRYRSAVGLSDARLGQFQRPWYKVGPGVCGEARWQTDYSCYTLDDQLALVPAMLARLYFDFARERLSRDFQALRRERLHLVPECSCWRCAEGRLTEYLLVLQVPLSIHTLPVILVTDDNEAPPLLLPEHAGANGEPDPTWSPSARVQCALRNGSWGVTSWLVEERLLPAAAARQIATEMNVAYSMKALWRDEGALRSLLRHLRQESGGAATKEAFIPQRARSALRQYAQRFLERNERHLRCSLPRAAAHAGCVAPMQVQASTPVNASAVRPAPVMSFIVQYYRHPRQLGIICERLRDPRIEVIVHADSNDVEDAAAFSVATATCGALILHSDNVHEIRGYNLAVRHSRGKLIAFSQDDRIPPYGGEWVERVLAVFHLDAFARLGALGLHRGGVRLWIQPTGGAPRMRMVGSCGDTADDVTGHKWDALLSERMTTPIRYVSFMNIGPIIVRRVALDEVGGFNTSYSKPGQLGIGFDHEFIGRLWQAGWQSAVMCPSRVTAFRNGCGGKGSATNISARVAQMLRNRDMYRQQFEAHAEKIEGMVARAQESLMGDKQLLAQLGAVVNRCVNCEGSGDDLHALKYRSLGFDDTSACPTADVTKLAYEP